MDVDEEDEGEAAGEQQEGLVSEIYWGDMADLVDDDWRFLDQLSLAISARYGFISCTLPSCGFQLKGNWTNHVDNHCREFGQPYLADVEVKRVDQLLWENQGRESFAPTPDMLPVQGLCIYSGYVCSSCSPATPHCSATMTALKRHHRNNHHGSTPSYKQGYYQTFTKTGSIHFPVRARLPFIRTPPFADTFFFFYYFLTLVCHSRFTHRRRMMQREPSNSSSRTKRQWISAGPFFLLPGEGRLRQTDSSQSLHLRT